MDSLITRARALGVVGGCETERLLLEMANALAALPSSEPNTGGWPAGMAAVIEFAQWAIREGSWQGCDLDGGSIQEKAEALGLIKSEPYDPAIHGPNEFDPAPGDPYYTFAGPLANHSLVSDPTKST